jgi:hypothetical protein
MFPASASMFVTESFTLEDKRIFVCFTSNLSRERLIKEAIEQQAHVV